jgi:hypothetical protein
MLRRLVPKQTRQFTSSMPLLAAGIRAVNSEQLSSAADFWSTTQAPLAFTKQSGRRFGDRTVKAAANASRTNGWRSRSEMAKWRPDSGLWGIQCCWLGCLRLQHAQSASFLKGLLSKGLQNGAPVVRHCGTIRPVRLLTGEVFPLAMFRNSSRTTSYGGCPI